LTEELSNFVTLSRLTPQKDICTLISAFSIYRFKYGSGKLHIYGEGSLRLDLESFVQKLDMQEHIIFHGKTNDSISVLKKNQVFVLSSKYEGFGLVLLEAMQVGLPIICANNSAISEVMGQDYEGFFKTSDVFELSNKLFESRNPIFYNRLASYCFNRLKFFNPVESAQNLIKIYQNALDNQMKIH
jgi:glycosyltransferase involved in cell wall biosynthesis